MDSRYQIADTSEIISPAMIVYADLVAQNLARMIEIAGRPARLRPHCKTHKMREVTRMELALGITRHKCATLAEAEMLAEAGARDIFLAYNLVGPNIARAVKFIAKFPIVAFSATADHAEPISELGKAMSAAGKTMELLLDIDSGQHRTGVEAGPRAKELYRLLAKTPGIRPGGLHLYDGQNHQKSVPERTAAVEACYAPVATLRKELLAEGLPVPRIVAGGTGSFPIFAKIDDPSIELSPGTIVFHDAGYSEIFPDLPFAPAVLLLTRVISRPTPNRVTLDLGYKAVASDPPAGNRVYFPDLPDAKAVLQNEEHLVLETNRAGEFIPGDELYAIPRHVCPTSALHKQAFVVSGGKLTGRWEVTARDRWLSI